jgi:antibiotic biosynthesis monooxygenase (ABM) superfamily enzyme
MTFFILYVMAKLKSCHHREIFSREITWISNKIEAVFSPVRTDRIENLSKWLATFFCPRRRMGNRYITKVLTVYLRLIPVRIVLPAHPNPHSTKLFPATLSMLIDQLIFSLPHTKQHYVAQLKHDAFVKSHRLLRDGDGLCKDFNIRDVVS